MLRRELIRSTKWFPYPNTTTIPKTIHRMKKTAILAAFAAFAVAAVAEDKIVIKGSDTLGAKLVPQLAEAYKGAGNSVSFEIAAEGSSTAFTALLEGAGDIGMSSRGIKQKEIDALAAKGMKQVEWLAGFDMIGVIVNEKNPVKNLTKEQIKSIFVGEVTDWSEVGGPAGPISIYTRNTSSGTFKAFQEMAMDEKDYSKDAQMMAGNEQIAQEVGKNANGIGYVGLAFATGEGIKAISVEGVELKAENAKQYPIARSLYYYTVEGKLSPAAEKFVKWATTSDDALAIVKKVHFIPAK